MKLLSIAFGLLAVGVQGSCTTDGIDALGDPYFNWIIKGSNDERSNNVSAICASADNTARTNFNARLKTLLTSCVPAGTNVNTSAFGVTAALLDRVLCVQKGDVARYCVLSLLPLFDQNYFFQLATGSIQVPPLAPVLDVISEKYQAMCASDVCSSFIENIVPGLLTRLPDTPEATIAAEFIRKTVNRMRCGCVGKVDPCQSTRVRDALIKDGRFIETAACNADGIPTECARNWITCEEIPVPTCAKQCTQRNLATIKFTLKNLDYACVTTNNALALIKRDVTANVPGLLVDDFTCACGAAVAPAVGTTCECNVTCANLATLQNLDLTKQFALLSTRATAITVFTPSLDKLLATCKISATAEDSSIGSSFVLESATFAPAPDQSGAAHVAGLSAVFALLASFLF